MKKKTPRGFHVLKCQDKSAYIYPQWLNYRARLQAKRSVPHVLSHIFQRLETWLDQCDVREGKSSLRLTFSFTKMNHISTLVALRTNCNICVMNLTKVIYVLTDGQYIIFHMHLWLNDWHGLCSLGRKTLREELKRNPNPDPGTVAASW